jgi:hypothetical protein
MKSDEYVIGYKKKGEKDYKIRMNNTNARMY